MAPNGLRICWGRRVRGDKRLECGEEVNDERVIEEVMRLINEFINRVEKHGDVLLSESSTLFDDVINALSDWLGKIETRIGEGDDESIANLRRAMLDIGKEMLRLLKQAREKWLKTYKPELEELINKLGSGGARVIISGEPFNSNKSFVAHLYTENLVVVIARVAKMGSITVNISLIGLEGVRMVVPRLFGDNRLRAMQYGLLLTDGTIDEEGYPVMGTNQLWQAFAWLIAWPGKNHVYINGLSLNNGYVSVMWYLRAVDRRGVFESKAVVAEEAGKLDVEDFLAFLLFVALGDGDVNVKRKRARLTMGSSKVELWSDIIERLRSLGFRIDRDNGYAVAYTAKPSKAVELARKMLGYPLIKALIEDLSQLPDAEKLKQLIELSGMEPKSLGRSSIEVAGVRINVHVNNNGTVELRTKRKGLEDAVAILEELKRAGYEAGPRPSGDYFEIYIGMYVIERDQEMARKVCEVLRRMLEEALGKGKIERAWATAKAMMYLGCPAQCPRAR